MAHLTFLRIALLQFKREFTTALSKRTGYKTAPNNDGDMNNRECCAMFEIDGTQYKEIHTSFFLVSKYDVSMEIVAVHGSQMMQHAGSRRKI